MAQCSRYAAALKYNQPRPAMAASGVFLKVGLPGLLFGCGEPKR